MTFVAYRVSRSIVNLEKKKWQLKISQHYHLNLFSASYTRDNGVELETFENKFEKKLKDLELELGEMKEIKEKLETLCAKVDGLDTSSSGFGHSVAVIEAELKEKPKETENTQRQMV